MSNSNANMKDDRNRISKILLAFYWLLLIMSVVVIGKLIYIQFGWEPDQERLHLFIPNSKKVAIKPERGEIKDCNGNVLASSTPLYTIRMDCQIQKAEMQNGPIPMGKDTLSEDKWRKLAKATCDALPALVDGNTTADEYYNEIILNRDSKDRRGRRNVKLITGIDHSTLLKIQKLPLFRLPQRFSGMMTDKRESRK